MAREIQEQFFAFIEARQNLPSTEKIAVFFFKKSSNHEPRWSFTLIQGSAYSVLTANYYSSC
ncbi:protein of unknown function [Georgfuchsia toluolica]|uniref:Uncharacterized protein n=1 Tax=Georgfuchsia toluolica TaxID=424218 RepID=A0A916NGG7_9PROT|nr:protein of unknown function [Georgfuchsia toluolica]